ncbi:MAG TPA: GTPase RsgA, partial [Anseongella sp.]|nr:GTPase RsgA [Anseongella sp.]
HLDALRAALRNKTSLFAGHSGAGKSTLVNKLIPDLNLKTAGISGFSGKGIHTTTFAEMFPLPPARPSGGEGPGGRASPASDTAASDGYIIDTPGIREFGIFDIQREELSHYFIEMRERFNQCKFDNCRHINEPGCAVIKAVGNGEISLSRYESYLSMYEGFDSRA